MGKKNRGRVKFGYFIIIVIFLTLIGAGGFFIGKMGQPYDKSNEDKVSVLIPMGSSTESIGETLAEKGIIGSVTEFKIVSKLNDYDNKFKHGEYMLSPSMSMEKIAEIIIKGNTNVTKFTIPEGLTVDEVSEKLQKDNIVNKDEFENQLKNASFEKYKIYKYVPLASDDESKENRLEGFLYPETYEIFTTSNSYDVIEKMIGHLDSLITDEYYKRADELGYNMYDIITIASMIQRETLVSGEKPIVASVIYNRLNVNHPLQIDATVQYVLPKHKERLYYSDLEVDSPYNTYKYTGLPKGPICSPDIESIKAALYPEDTDYFYYVLSSENNGTHKFSKTYSEFLKNKQEYINSL